MLRVLEPLRQDEGIVDGKDTKDSCAVWEGRTRREKEKKKDKRNKEQGTRKKEQGRSKISPSSLRRMFEMTK